MEHGNGSVFVTGDSESLLPFSNKRRIKGVPSTSNSSASRLRVGLPPPQRQRAQVQATLATSYGQHAGIATGGDDAASSHSGGGDAYAGFVTAHANGGSSGFSDYVEGSTATGTMMNFAGEEYGRSNNRSRDDMPSSPLSVSATLPSSRKRSWVPSLQSPTASSHSDTPPQQSHGPFSLATSLTSRAVASRPIHPPRGEFAREEDRDMQQKSYPNSTMRLNHVQQLEMQRQRIASGDYGVADSQQQGQASEQGDEPPSKRRRGMAGAIVETALNATLMAGAAAITAYSLWSSWGRKEDNPNAAGQQQQQPTEAMSDPDALMPGGIAPDSEPPPPYHVDPSLKSPLSPARSQSSAGTPRRRGRHVFISQSRRRKPLLFQQHQQHHNQQQSPAAIRTIAAALQRQADEQVAQRVAAAEEAAAAASSTASGLTATEEDEAEEDEDEMYKRFEQRMQSMIAEGQAALSSKVNLDHIDVHDEEGMGMSISVSEPAYLSDGGHRPQFGQGLPSSRSEYASLAPRRLGDLDRRPSSLASAGASEFNFNFHETASVFHSPTTSSRIPQNPFVRASRGAGSGGGLMGSRTGAATAMGGGTPTRTAGATGSPTAFKSSPYSRGGSSLRR